MTTAIATIDNNDNNAYTPNGFICTVNAETREGAIQVANALNDAKALNDMGDAHFLLAGVITAEGVRSRTGEICVNTYLIAADGNCYFTQSDGIRRSAEQIVALFNGDFGDGIEVAVSAKELPNGNTLKTLHFYA